MSRFENMSFDELDELHSFYQEGVEMYESLPEMFYLGDDDEKLEFYRQGLSELVEYMDSIEGNELEEIDFD